MKGRPYELTFPQRILLLLFFVIFAGGGSAMLIRFLENNVYGYWRTRAGVTTQAQLRSVETRYHRSGRGTGSVSTEASYDYEVDGQRFTASKVTLFKTTESYYRPLKRALDTHQPIRIFIDPADPRFAVIDRGFAWYPLVIAVPFFLSWITGGLFLGWCLWMNFRGKTVPVKSARIFPAIGPQATTLHSPRSSC